MNATTLQDVFHEELRDILDAEAQMMKALPKMADAAECDALREGLRAQLNDTQAHHQRLELIFGMIGAEPSPKKCDAMQGLIKEGKQAIGMTTDNRHLRDTLLICNAKKLDAYQMSAYQSLTNWAMDLGLNEAADLLDWSFQEAKEAEKKFEKLDERESVMILASNEEKGASAHQSEKSEGEDFIVPLM